MARRLARPAANTLLVTDRLRAINADTAAIALAVADQYTTALRDRAISQHTLHTASLFRDLAATASAPYDAFVDVARTLYAHAESAADVGERVRVSTEVGARVLLMEDSRRVTVSWKEIALQQAAVLARLVTAANLKLAPELAAYAAFDATVWERKLKENKPRSGAISVRVVEA